MKSIHFKSHIITILTLIIFSCENDKPFLEISYDEWTVTGDGLSAPVTKNVLTEFVGSTNCPYSPEADALLLSYFNTEHENYVGNSINELIKDNYNVIPFEVKQYICLGTIKDLNVYNFWTNFFNDKV